MTDMPPSSAFRDEVRRGAGPASAMLVKAITGAQEVQPPVENDPATSITLSFRQDLEADEREIFRESVLEVFDAYASGSLLLDAAQFDTLTYLAAVSSTPRRRRTELTQLLHCCLTRAQADETPDIAQSVLNLMADEVLITNIREWDLLFKRLGPAVGFQCFYGIGRLDLSSALSWLDHNLNEVDYETIRDFAFPSLIKAWLSIDPSEAISPRLSNLGNQRIADDYASFAEQVTAIPTPWRHGPDADHERRKGMTSELPDVSGPRGSTRPRLTLIRNAEQADAVPGDAAFYPPGLALIAGL